LPESRVGAQRTATCALGVSRQRELDEECMGCVGISAGQCAGDRESLPVLETSTPPRAAEGQRKQRELTCLLRLGRRCCEIEQCEQSGAVGIARIGRECAKLQPERIAFAPFCQRLASRFVVIRTRSNVVGGGGWVGSLAAPRNVSRVHQATLAQRMV